MLDLRRALQIVSVVVLLAASPWILAGLFITVATTWGAIDERLHRDRTSFSAEKWRTGSGKVRFSYVDALLTNGALVDQRPSLVKDTLGAPDRVENGNRWHYDVERPGFRVVDFTGGGVAIVFDEADRVSKVEDTRWID